MSAMQRSGRLRRELAGDSTYSGPPPTDFSCYHACRRRRGGTHRCGISILGLCSERCRVR